MRRRIGFSRRSLVYLGYVMVAMGVLAVLTLPAYNLTFDFMAWCLGTFTRTASGYVAFNLISQSIAALIMIPATFCAGMTLPLLTQGLMRRGTGETAIGTIYSVNTLGAIVGVLLTIHVLMPLIGVKGVILAGGAIHVALGLSRLFAGVAIHRAPRPWPDRRDRGARSGRVRGQPGSCKNGVRRLSHRVGRAAGGARVAYLRDGKTATISLVEPTDGDDSHQRQAGCRHTDGAGEPTTKAPWCWRPRSR